MPNRIRRTSTYVLTLTARAIPTLATYAKPTEKKDEQMRHDLTTAERNGLMAHLLAGRDHFAGHLPRVADYFNDRLIELDDDRRAEAEFFKRAERDVLPIEPGTATIIDDEGDG